MIPPEAVEAAARAMSRSLGLSITEQARLALEAAAPHMHAGTATKLRGWYDERMNEEPATDVTLTEYEQGRKIGATEGILAAALMIEATK